MEHTLKRITIKDKIYDLILEIPGSDANLFSDTDLKDRISQVAVKIFQKYSEANNTVPLHEVSFTYQEEVIDQKVCRRVFIKKDQALSDETYYHKKIIKIANLIFHTKKVSHIPPVLPETEIRSKLCLR